MTIFLTFYVRLSVCFLMLVVILGAVLLMIVHYTSDMYAKEVTQRFNRDIAMHIVAEHQLIKNNAVNKLALEGLAHRMLLFNPTVEVYLLDRFGRILANTLPVDSAVREKVSLLPIHAFISSAHSLPVMGDDPKNVNKEKIFSVSAIKEDEVIVGYLYAVLGETEDKTIWQHAQESYILKVGLVSIVGSLLVAVLFGCIIFFFLTSRLRRLTYSVKQFQDDKYQKGIGFDEQVISGHPRDEVDQLSIAVHNMSEHIRQQFDTLKRLDKTRRELVSNVSHDLRTPLAVMHGYIETLLMEGEQLDLEEKTTYLKEMHKYSQSLTHLVSEFFELEKLDSGSVRPTIEVFLLMDLIHDSVQDYQSRMKEKNITLTITTELDNCSVCADITLIQRVLQNLLDHALIYTPDAGTITVDISENEGRALIDVSNTGRGIQMHQIPHIFERYYCSQQEQSSSDIGTGLGLAIVKRILDLHQSSIRVYSELNKKTRFVFDLPVEGYYKREGVAVPVEL